MKSYAKTGKHGPRPGSKEKKREVDLPNLYVPGSSALGSEDAAYMRRMTGQYKVT